MRRSSSKWRLPEVLEEDGVARYMRVAFGLLGCYLVVTLIPAVSWGSLTGHWSLVALHLLLIGVVVFLAARHRTERVQLRADWLPLLLVPVLYAELGLLLSIPGHVHNDAAIRELERNIFGQDVSTTFAINFQHFALSEVLHACYLSYYALVLVPPVLLWRSDRRQEFAATIMSLALVFSVCFAIYAIFPVDGPRFDRGPSDAPAGPIRYLVIRILEHGSSRGTAFPSSHAAAAVVAAVCALRFQRAVGVVVSTLATGLAVGAVYGGYHYGVDVGAGVALGLTVAAIARSIEGTRVLARTTRPLPVKYEMVRERIQRRVDFNENEKRRRTAAQNAPVVDRESV